MAKTVRKSTKKIRARKRLKNKQLPFWPFGLFGFLLLLAIDQYTKRAIHSTLLSGQSVEIISGLWFTHVQNTGATWGLFQNANAFLIIFSVVAFVVIAYFRHEFRTVVEKISLSLIMVGLWGNLLDRLFLGYVIDFIDLGWWPVFNIADSAICVGVIIFFLEQWRKSKYNISRIPA